MESESSPIFGVKIKRIWNHHLDKRVIWPGKWVISMFPHNNHPNFSEADIQPAGVTNLNGTWTNPDWADVTFLLKMGSSSSYVTLPETNSSPLKMGAPWKRKFLVETTIFRGYVSLESSWTKLWGFGKWFCQWQPTTNNTGTTGSREVVLFPSNFEKKHVFSSCFLTSSENACQPLPGFFENWDGGKTPGSLRGRFESYRGWSQ